MTIDCRNDELRDLLPAYAHGRLDAGDQSRVAAHVASCAACAAEIEIIRAARTSFSRVPTVDTGRIVASLPAPSARPALRVERGGGQAPQRRGWLARAGALRIAAGIAAIAIGGVGLKVASDGRGTAVTVEQPTPDLPAPNRVATVDSGAATGEAAVTPAQSVEPSRPSQPRAPAPALASGMTFGGGVGDLGEEELRDLLADLDDLDAVPAAEPESEREPVGLEEGR